ncbi:MAG: hypothetical protein AB7G28_13440 [Pirellulales bacterium]
MGNQVTAALDALRRLGTPAEIRAMAERGYGPGVPPRVNSHIHLPPNFSAFDTVEQAVDVAAAQAIGVLGVSNYYDYDVYGEFVERAGRRGIFPLFGLEIISMQDSLRDAGIKVNDPGNPGKTYLCGKGITRFDRMSPAAERLLATIRHNDAARMAAMVERMRATCRERGFDPKVDEASIVEMIVRRHGSPRSTVYLQERHISQAVQESLFAAVGPRERFAVFERVLGAAPKLSDADDYVGVQNELRSHLMKAGKPAFVEEEFLSFDEAKQLVLELGGIPSYPVLADGASPMCEFEADPDRLIRALQSRGVHAVEWIPIRNKVSVVAEYIPKMRAAGFAVTAGTEHNTLDLVAFDPFCKDGPVPDNIRQIFWEGSCMAAAHQFLSLHGERGYVDTDGRPNSDHNSADVRIKELAKIGAAVIQRYFESNPKQ